MEIHFQQQQQPEAAAAGSLLLPMAKTTKFKGRNRNRSKSNNSKYVGVRQRPSGRWIAEIKDTTQKIRMWLGTFETAEEAARAYDEAACLLRGSNTRTNFVTHVSPDSPLASRIRNLLNSKRKANQTPPALAHAHAHANDDSRTTTIATPPPSSPSSCSSNISSVDSLSPMSEKPQHKHSSSNLFDDAYKPDLSNCCTHEFQMGPSVISWGLEQPAFDYRASFLEDQLIDHPKNVASQTGDMEFLEFERMKVERQISASLYAMNGVHEYMETVCDPIEALWDLPPLCSLLC